VLMEALAECRTRRSQWNQHLLEEQRAERERQRALEAPR
jgi:hypothetical protein